MRSLFTFCLTTVLVALCTLSAHAQRQSPSRSLIPTTSSDWAGVGIGPATSMKGLALGAWATYQDEAAAVTGQLHFVQGLGDQQDPRSLTDVAVVVGPALQFGKMMFLAQGGVGIVHVSSGTDDTGTGEAAHVTGTVIAFPVQLHALYPVGQRLAIGATLYSTFNSLARDHGILVSVEYNLFPWL